MKAFITSIVLLLSATPALATSDANTRVYLVVQHVQSGDYFIERAPLIGCYGIARGPQLAQFTNRYNAPTNIGCGGVVATENINALACATVVSSIESADYNGFSAITLNISKCPAKNDARFITMVRTAAKLNFPLRKGEVLLRLIK